nr:MULTISPECIES: VOC family protein [unclassified Cryobacterium]
MNYTGAFSGFSVDDLEEARRFYSESLGLTVSDAAMGTLSLTLPGGARVMVYEKETHEPSTHTVLNFEVDDVDVAVDELNNSGIKTKIYDDPELNTDERGIARDEQLGMEIAWFLDPAGNPISVLRS